MAKIFKISMSQEAQEYTEKRVIVQYIDDQTEEKSQTIINYEDLSVSEKATYDAYKTLCESKIPA